MGCGIMKSHAVKQWRSGIVRDTPEGRPGVRGVRSLMAKKSCVCAWIASARFVIRRDFFAAEVEVLSSKNCMENIEISKLKPKHI